MMENLPEYVAEIIEKYRKENYEAQIVASIQTSSPVDTAKQVKHLALNLDPNTVSKLGFPETSILDAQTVAFTINPKIGRLNVDYQWHLVDKVLGQCVGDYGYGLKISTRIYGQEGAWEVWEDEESGKYEPLPTTPPRTPSPTLEDRLAEIVMDHYRETGVKVHTVDFNWMEFIGGEATLGVVELRTSKRELSTGEGDPQ